jgi:hypothetical protein
LPKILRDCDFDLPASLFGDFGDMLYSCSESIAAVGVVLLEGEGSPVTKPSIARLRDGVLEVWRVSPEELIDAHSKRKVMRCFLQVHIVGRACEIRELNAGGGGGFTRMGNWATGQAIQAQCDGDEVR